MAALLPQFNAVAGCEVIGSNPRTSGQMVLQFLAAPQATSRRIPRGVQDLSRDGTLVADPDESTSFISMMVAVHQCGALVMRSGGVCMLFASRGCITRCVPEASVMR